MSNYFEWEPKESDAIIQGAVGLCIGLFLAWVVAKDRGWNEALEWATATTEHCEESHRTEGYSSVTDCLKRAIAEAKEEERQRMQEDGPVDPRR